MNNTVMSNNAWDTLSLPEKAGMMRVAVRNGIYNLKDIRDKYNKFAEGGDINDSWTLEDENNYQLWRASLPDNLKNTNDSEYDMRRAFKVGMNPSLEADGKYHLQSRDPRTGRILKAPYHPTYLQAINTDARMGYYPVVDTDGNTFTETWKGNQFKKGGRKKPVYGINNDVTQQAMQYFIGKGLTDYQAAGLVGNLFRESRLNPTATNSGSGAYGIAQWLGDRKKNLFAKYGNNPSLSQQLDYVWHELNNTHKTGLNKLMSSRDSAEAARNAMGYYEFSAGPDAAIREMKKWGQNGERSMQEGIDFASQLSGQPIVPYRTENPQWKPVAFTPSNPEVFFGNPAAVYTSPAVEVEQPVLKAAEDYAYNEQQERKDNLERFNIFMSMLNPSSNNSDLTDTVELLSFGNRFDAGGPKKPVTKNDLRRMLQRNRAEAEAAYNSSIAETWTIPNDNAWVDRPLTRRKKNPHTEKRAVEGAKADAAWRQEHPVATAIGAGLSAAPLAIAATPAVVGSGELGAAVLANPYVDAGLTSAFAGHGLNKLVNGEIENTSDAAMTALELTPLGRLAKPVYEGVAQPGMRLFNSPLTGNWTKINSREYRLSPNSLGANGSPLESREVNPQGNITDNLLKWLDIPDGRVVEKSAQEYLNNRFSPEYQRMAQMLQNKGIDLSRLDAKDIKKIFDKRLEELRNSGLDRVSVARPIGDRHFSVSDFILGRERPVGEMELEMTEDGTALITDITNYTRNTANPVKGVQERGLNSAINVSKSVGGNGVITGREYQSAPRQYHVVQKFKDRNVIGHDGIHYNSNMVNDYEYRMGLPNTYDEYIIPQDKETWKGMLELARAGERRRKALYGAPVWKLGTPTFNTPTKSILFDPTIIDNEGRMIVDWDNSNIFRRFGGRLYTKR